MTRRLRFAAAGAVVGAAGAGWVWHLERAVVAAGENAAGVGFGAAHLLFFVSLPWSLAVWVLMIVASLATGVDGAAFTRPCFYAMPVVAGAGCAWVATFVRRPERRDEPAAPVV